MDESKQLEFGVTALEHKIQLELAPPKPEAAQEQQADGGTMQVQSSSIAEQAKTELPSELSNQSQLLQEHVQFVKPLDANSTAKGIKM